MLQKAFDIFIKFLGGIFFSLVFVWWALVGVVVFYWLYMWAVKFFL